MVVVACAKPAKPPSPPTPTITPTITSTPSDPCAANPCAGPIDATHRALTPGEVALVRPIFRDSLDYGAVRVIDARYMLVQPSSVYMTPEGNIYAPGELWRDDFSATDLSRQAVFVHEMTHVWQFQSGKDLLAEGATLFVASLGNYERAYAYDLEPSRDLLDYGMEQQASIVQDYFLVGHQAWPVALREPAHRDRFHDVLAAFLADPGYARAKPTDEVARAHLAQASSAPEAEPARAGYMCAWRFGDRHPAAPADR